MMLNSHVSPFHRLPTRRPLDLKVKTTLTFIQTNFSGSNIVFVYLFKSFSDNLLCLIAILKPYILNVLPLYTAADSVICSSVSADSKILVGLYVLNTFKSLDRFVPSLFGCSDICSISCTFSSSIVAKGSCRC